jgi:hypothetical protein
MGVPQHYSLDIAMRCQSLIHYLLPKVVAGLPHDKKFGGSLHTTFLLAMATPMILLPIERIFKPAQDETVADDRELDVKLADRFAGIISPHMKFGETPFFKGVRWSYIPKYTPFNIGHQWPDDLLTKLASEEGVIEAATTNASRILIDLRNALAHGGVAYLDKYGRNTDIDREAAIFAFVAARKDKKNMIVGLNILRISEKDFLIFLQAWMDWVQNSPVADSLRNVSAFAA